MGLRRNSLTAAAPAYPKSTCFHDPAFRFHLSRVPAAPTAPPEVLTGSRAEGKIEPSGVRLMLVGSPKENEGPSPRTRLSAGGTAGPGLCEAFRSCLIRGWF